MIDFWSPSTALPMPPPLGRRVCDGFRIGTVDSLRIRQRELGVPLDARKPLAELVWSRQIGWHRDTGFVEVFSASISYCLILESYGHMVQCRDRRTDAESQDVGSIVAFDLNKTHRLLAPANPKLWVGLSVLFREPTERGIVEDQMLKALEELSVSEYFGNLCRD
jgi:hypothetical protein